jgi:predicted esterase
MPYRSNVAMVELLLDNPSDDDLVQMGKVYRFNANYSRAAFLHLTALRTRRDDPIIEYELACDFALWHQVKLGMQYLQRAADHGYWGYSVVKDDTDLIALKDDPAFPAALDKIKASFAVEAPRNAPGMTVKMPVGDVPAAGWPVVVLPHGWGSNRHDFDSSAAFVATLGYIGITLDGNDVMGPGAYSWGMKSVDVTNDRVQAAITSLKVKTDPKRIYLHGFSQGAMHAARLLADHPDLYAGAICNSPGSFPLVPRKLSDPAHTGTVVLSVGSAEAPIIGKGVDAIQKLWESAGRPVHVIHFEGGHQLPPDSESMFRNALEELSAVK